MHHASPSHHSASPIDVKFWVRLDDSAKDSAALTLLWNTTDPLPKFSRSSSLASADSTSSAPAVGVYSASRRRSHPSPSGSRINVTSRVRSEGLNKDAAALRVEMQQNASDPQKLLRVSSLASTNSEYSAVTTLSFQARRRVPRVLAPRPPSTTSGSRFYAAVIRSAVKKVDQARQVDQAQRHKKGKFRLGREEKLERLVDNLTPSYEMLIIVVLALFYFGLLVACVVFAFSLVNDKSQSDWVSTLRTFSLLNTNFAGIQVQETLEIYGADMIKKFGCIAVLFFWLGCYISFKRHSAS